MVNADLSSVIKLFPRARYYALRLQDAQQLTVPTQKSEKPQMETYMAAVAQVAFDVEQELLQDLECLPEGGSLLLPMTWITGNRAAHATALLFTREPNGGIELVVSNTGEGTQYHPSQHDRSRQLANTLNRYQLTLEQLREFHVLRQLMEINVAGGRFVSLTRPYRPADFYAVLAPFAVSSRELDVYDQAGWRKTQLAGSCSFRCYCPILRLVLMRSGATVQDYKRVMDLMKERGLAFGVGQWAPLIDSRPSFAKLFSIAVPHLFATSAPSMTYLSVGSALRTLGRTWLRLSPEAFVISPAQAKALIEQLGELFKLYANARDPAWNFVENLTTLTLTLVLVWRLTSIVESGEEVEQRLTDHAPFDAWDWIQHSQHMNHHVFLNAESERDVLLLQHVFRDVKSSDLFHFSSHQLALPKVRHDDLQLYALRLNASSGEHQYLLAQAALYKDKWQEADSALNAVLRETEVKGTPVVDQSVWRANWLQATGGLPSYYYTLRNMALAVHVVRRGYVHDGVASAFMMAFYHPDGTPDLHPGAQIDELRINMVVCYATNRSLERVGDDVDSIPTPFTIGRDRRKDWFSFAIPQKERTQNEAISQKDGLGSKDPVNGELRSIRYTACAGRPSLTLAPWLLFDQYDGQWDRFLDPVQRLFFEYTLFASPRLMLTLQERPQLAVEGAVFLQRALQHFEEGLRGGTAPKGSASAYVFFVQQQMRFWNYCLAADIEEVDGGVLIRSLLDQRREEIQKQLVETGWTPAERAWLHAARQPIAAGIQEGVGT